MKTTLPLFLLKISTVWVEPFGSTQMSIALGWMVSSSLAMACDTASLVLAWRMALDSWAPRLSIMIMPPGEKVGTCNVLTEVRKCWPLIGLSSSHGALARSWRRATSPCKVNTRARQSAISRSRCSPEIFHDLWPPIWSGATLPVSHSRFSQ